MSQFPVRRMRRLRRTVALRRLVQETHLVPSQLVWPLFACHGEGVRRAVGALPGVFQTSIDELVKDAERAQRLGLGGIILFGLPAMKDGTGSEAYDEQGIVQQAARGDGGGAVVEPETDSSAEPGRRALGVEQGGHGDAGGARIRLLDFGGSGDLHRSVARRHASV